MPGHNCININEVSRRSRKTQRYCRRPPEPGCGPCRTPRLRSPSDAAAGYPNNGGTLPLKKKENLLHKFARTSLFSLSSYHIYKGRKRYHGNTLPGNLGGLARCPIVARALLSMAVGESANVRVCESASCNYLCMGENNVLFKVFMGLKTVSLKRF